MRSRFRRGAKLGDQRSVSDAQRALIVERFTRRLVSDPSTASLWGERNDLHEPVLTAAVLCSEFEGFASSEASARMIAAASGSRPDTAALAGFLVAHHRLLPAVVVRRDAFDEQRVLDLAFFVGDTARSDALFLLTSGIGVPDAERALLVAIHDRISEVLSRSDLRHGAGRRLVERRETDLARIIPHVSERAIREHLWAAPRRYLMAQPPETVARHLHLLQGPIGDRQVRLEADAAPEPGRWVVHVGLRDRLGALAAISGAFSDLAISVRRAQISTWRNGLAIDQFEVDAPEGIDWDRVAQEIERRLRSPVAPSPEVVGGTVSFDQHGSPLHTVVDVRADDRRGLLYRVASTFAAAAVEVHEATIATDDGHVADTFWVTGPGASKLERATQQVLVVRLGARETLP